MAAPSLKDQFLVGTDVLLTKLADNGKILAQIGCVGSGSGDASGASTAADNVEWWQHVGFASRPSKPDPGKAAAQAFVIRQGGNDIAIASQDVRSLAMYGALKDGETCIYAAGADGKAQARSLYKADGSIHHYTRKGNTEGGTGMAIIMDATAGAITIVNDKGFGLIINSDGVMLTAGSAGLTLKSGGDITLAGTGQTQVDGAGVCLGSLAVPGVNSALTGVTGVAGKASLKVLIE